MKCAKCGNQVELDAYGAVNEGDWYCPDCDLALCKSCVSKCNHCGQSIDPASLILDLERNVFCSLGCRDEHKKENKAQLN